MRHTLSFALILSLPLAGAACTTADVEDDLAGEDRDGEAGKADGNDETFTYYSIRPDYRRCVAPLCGGYWVSRVNRSKTTCADGSKAEACYVAELDDAVLGATGAARLRLGVSEETALVRGSIEDNVFADWGNLGRFVVTEGWTAGAADGAADGIFVMVEQTGIRCIAAPCADKAEKKLNSVLRAMISELDFTPSGATDAELEAAYAGLLPEAGPGGLIVAGDRYIDRVDGRKAKARTVTQFWTRIIPSGDPTQGSPCVVTGCSGQVCADQDVITTCEWRPEYACYDTAACERQPDGACGWTDTPELAACLAAN